MIFFRERKRCHYLIDSENVGRDFLAEMPKVRKRDFVYLLYSRNSDKFHLEDLEALESIKGALKLEKVFLSGANSLDFQLSTYVGYLIAYFPKDSFIILSRDKGFDCVVEFWKNKGIAIRRDSCRKAESPKLERQGVEQTSKHEQIETIIARCQIQGKDAVYRELVATFGQDEGLAIYRQVKKRLI